MVGKKIVISLTCIKLRTKVDKAETTLWGQARLLPGADEVDVPIPWLLLSIITIDSDAIGDTFEYGDDSDLKILK